MNPRAIALILTIPRLFSFLVMLIVALVVLYMYFVTNAVMEVVLQRQSIEEEKRLRSEIAALETRYIEAQHTISERVATLSTFTATSEKIFIDQTKPALVMNSNVTY